MFDPLIYGKDQTERIVGMEIEDDVAYLWIEKEDGTLVEETRSNRFWILSSRKHNKNFIQLKGDQPFKYGVQFKTRKEFTQMRNIWKNGDLYTIWNEKEAFMCKDGVTYFKGMKSPLDVSTLSFDIETTGINHDETAKVILIANTFRKAGKITRKMFCYDEYETEADLINAWCAWVRFMNPAILTGHNIEIYDIPYLDFCARRSGTYLQLGRNDSPIKFGNKPSKFRKDGSQTLDYFKPHIYGREVIDTMFLAVKYDTSRKFPNYRLKDIIKYLDAAIENRQYYDAATIRDNYTNPGEMKKIKAYAEQDGDEALVLFDKMYAPSFFMTQSIPKSAQAVMESATGSQINSMMVRSYLQNSHSIARADDAVPFQGALSAATPGIYSNCVRWDIVSLYPSIMRQYKIYNEQKDPNKNFLNLVEFFTIERLKNKKLAKDTGNNYYDHLQGSQKILANSLYGALGAPGLNYNSTADAALITTKGREILGQAVKWASGKTVEELFYETKEVSDDTNDLD